MRFLNSLATSAPVRGLVAACLMIAAPTFAAAQSCPDFAAPAATDISYTLAELEAGVSVEMLAGGDVDLSSCDIEGFGYFVSAPDYEVTVPDMPEGYGLMVGVDSTCDTMLLINGPDAQYSFNDDYDNLNPMLVRMDGAGAYDIWVGTLDTEVCEATLMLIAGAGFEELAAADLSGLDGDLAAASGACPDPMLDGSPLSLTAADLTAGHVEAMLAGGDVDLANCADLPGFGNVITNPDYDLDIDGLAENGQFTIGVTSECDTILLVNDAAGEWHYSDDENSSHNPELKLSAGNGRYDVWVGTYGTEICDAELTFADAGQRLTK